MVQIKDDVVVHGKGKKHDVRLQALFERVAKFQLTLRPEKCNLGQQEVKWFGHIYSGQGMSPDPEKVETIQKLCGKQLKQWQNRGHRGPRWESPDRRSEQSSRLCK